MKIRRKHFLGLLVLMPILGLLVGWSGFVGVRASTGHWAVTDWFLHWVMRNSVRTAAIGVEAPPLNDPAMLPLAAGHYEAGCAICHGSPGAERSQAVLSMLPVPPDLRMIVPTWTDEQLYEIVKHGVRLTGMPGWPAESRDDEVWAMVAFLRELPDLDANGYRELAGFERPVFTSAFSETLATCEACHAENRLNDGSLIPSLSGQSENYLLGSLRAYAEGERASGVMQVAAGSLHDDVLRQLAAHYAGQSRPVRPPMTADPAPIERGRELAERGRPEDKIPACLTCHERPNGNPAYPSLAGQSSAYLKSQLRLFQQGIRGGTQYSHLMTEAAKNMEEGDIEALAAYFSRRELQAEQNGNSDSRAGQTGTTMR